MNASLRIVLAGLVLSTGACGFGHDSEELSIDAPDAPLAVDAQAVLRVGEPGAFRCWSLLGSCGGRGPVVKVSHVSVEPAGVVEVVSTESGLVTLRGVDVGLASITVEATIDGDPATGHLQLLVEEAARVELLDACPMRFAVQDEAQVPMTVVSEDGRPLFAHGLDAVEIDGVPQGLALDALLVSVDVGQEAEVRSLLDGEVLFTAVGVDGGIPDWKGQWSARAEARGLSFKIAPAIDDLPLYGFETPACMYTIESHGEGDGGDYRYSTGDCPLGTTTTPEVCSFASIACRAGGDCVAGVDSHRGRQVLAPWSTWTPLDVIGSGTCSLRFETRAGVVLERSFEVRR